MQREGYSGLPGNDDDYGTRNEDLEGEEEGHGRAIVADMGEEHVSLFFNYEFVCLIVHLG